MVPPIPRLESLHRVFAEALDDAAHELPLVAHLRPAPPFPAFAGEQAGAAASSGPDTVRRRIGLYRVNVRTHWRAALANAYPVLHALVGDAYFDTLSLAYARAYPSRSGDLNAFGARLPDFVDGYERDARFRYFADVARLEWALHVAFFAADVPSLTAEQWIEIGEARLLGESLAVHPACTAIASRYAIGDIWLAHQPDGVVPEQVDRATWVVTVRPHWQPTVLIHSAAAHAAFIGLQAGRSLNEALDSAFALDPGFDFASQWQVWISARAITGVNASA